VSEQLSELDGELSLGLEVVTERHPIDRELGFEPADRVVDEARLANARLADDEHVGGEATFEAPPRVEQPLHRVRAPHEELVDLDR